MGKWGYSDQDVPQPLHLPLVMPQETAISLEVWIGPSLHYPHAGNSLWVRFKPGSQPPAAYAALSYGGESNDSRASLTRISLRSTQGMRIFMVALSTSIV